MDCGALKVGGIRIFGLTGTAPTTVKVDGTSLAPEDWSYDGTKGSLSVLRLGLTSKPLAVSFKISF